MKWLHESKEIRKSFGFFKWSGMTRTYQKGVVMDNYKDKEKNLFERLSVEIKYAEMAYRKGWLKKFNRSEAVDFAKKLALAYSMDKMEYVDALNEFEDYIKN